MTLPIIAYGNPVLREVCDEIAIEYDGLQPLLDNMYDTMYNAQGVGLAAPQIGKAIRLFLIDTTPFTKDEDAIFQEEPVQQTFINAKIIDRFDASFSFNEGCLSLPGIREDVIREASIRIAFQDEKFKQYEREFYGFAARVIQHEYDHIEGILFTDYLRPLKKRLIKKRLNKIASGDVRAGYKMKFYVKPKKL